jgi:hypothetical protein
MAQSVYETEEYFIIILLRPSFLPLPQAVDASKFIVSTGNL